MFDVSFSDLAKRSYTFSEPMTILDCPGGPSSFAHFMNSHSDGNVKVTAVDPEYGKSEGELFADGYHDLIAQKKTSLQSVGPFAEAFEEFISDYASADPGTYVAAKLPSRLPFDDESFDITLSGYLLFVYSPQHDGGLGLGSNIDCENASISDNDNGFDLAFHRAAIRELLRVTKGEVRIFPAHTMSATNSADRHPFAVTIAEEINAEGEFDAHFYSSSFHSGGSSHEGSIVGLCIRRKTSHEERISKCEYCSV
jgi:hypothetical protein